MATLLRRLVSRRKRRYEQDGFSLDLAYINCGDALDRRVLAMGFPAEGQEAWYRNDIKEVKRFLDNQRRAGNGNYRVYNLCSERAYDPAKLGKSVALYPFDDHQAPSLLLMLAFCRDLDAFLGQNPDNFAAVHCKAGKGRTGVMICGYFLYKGLVANAEEALQVYAHQRTTDGSGVTVPSQSRYVRYFEAVVADQRLPSPSPLSLQGITVLGLSAKQLAELVVVVYTRPTGHEGAAVVATLSSSAGCVRADGASRIFKGSLAVDLQTSSADDGGWQGPLELEGDVKMEVYHGRAVESRLLFRTWFHTAFVSAGAFLLRSWEVDKGNSSVPRAAALRIQLGEAGNLNAHGSTTSLLGAGSLGRVSAEATLSHAESCNADSIPAVLASFAEAQPIQELSDSPYLLDIHPDFSMPAYFCTLPKGPLTPTQLPPSPVNPFAQAAVQQLPPSPSLQHSRSATALDFAPLMELTNRLESIALQGPAGSLVDGLVVHHDGSGRLHSHMPAGPFRSHSLPAPRHKQFVIKTATLAECPRLRPISTARQQGVVQAPATPARRELRVRCVPNRDLDLDEDPELEELSAPTTPSLPRPLASMDWRPESSGSLPLLYSSRSLELRPGWSSELMSPRSRFAFVEGTASGPDSPSHGARMIKWMSSSWWLSMA